MKVNVGLIGKGKWGKNIEKKLKVLANLKFVSGKKNNLINDIKKNNIKWIFIATPNNTHYTIVKKCIQNNVNVFCEKPLCLTYTKAKKLINYSNKKGARIFVSDLYAYYSKKIKYRMEENNIFRSKHVSGKDNEFLFRFMYHDLSILYTFLKNNKILNIYFKKNEKIKNNEVLVKFNKNILIRFRYNLNAKKKEHYINKLLIKSKKDLLKDMIQNVLLNKVNFNDNNKKALFIIKLLNKIKRKYKNVY